MTFDHQSLDLLASALASLDAGFSRLPEFQPRIDLASIQEVLAETATRLHDNYPYHHPFYIGQMLKPPHPIARLAYALAMFNNPNNHALDGGRASSAMEKEAVADIARMFGWSTHLGHLCGGGTMANFEALWVARQLRPKKAIAASAQAHYTHSRLSAVLGVPFHKVDADSLGRMNIPSLQAALASGDIGTVVVTLGTTAAGACDPLADVLELRRKYDFRIHVDSAYGGYFTLARNLGPHARRQFDALPRADSIVVDPHKHGLQPYGCGCVLFADPSVGRFYQHDSPYTYFSSPDLHLGEISLECSRAGASAVALWATMRMFPLVPGGEFASGLESCRRAALSLHSHLQGSAHFVPLFEPELDVVTFAVRAPSPAESSRLARRVFDEAARRDLHLALAAFPRSMVEPCGAISSRNPGAANAGNGASGDSAAAAPSDQPTVTCLRACAMKPEHAQWLPQIQERLDDAANAALEIRARGS